mmetsp:Transcript_10627/g.14763  ORF Transcript_10627/g.14763 Transcript_10627/m.14763 type:complete len:287 (+) Transcript_10627:2-862(+)
MDSSSSPSTPPPFELSPRKLAPEEPTWKDPLARDEYFDANNDTQKDSHNNVTLSPASEPPSPPQRARAQVVLNVYDLNPRDAKEKHVTNVNDWSLQVGFGAFHSGVQVYGVEWSFGSSCDDVEAIQPCNPRKCCPLQYTYRQTVIIGWTDLTKIQVEDLIEAMTESDRYQGTAYNLLKNNCNDFSDDLCRRLTGKGIPNWVNRGAKALRSVIDGAGNFVNHPITKSFASAFVFAKQGISDGVTVGVSAMQKTYEASQSGLKDLCTGVEKYVAFGFYEDPSNNPHTS